MPTKHLLGEYHLQLAKKAVAQAPMAQAQAARPVQQVLPRVALKPITPPTSTLNLQPHPSQRMAQPAVPQAPQKMAAAQNYLAYLRTELLKQASELGDECPYSEDQINHITSSTEAFEKAAQEEAQCVWAGIEDTLRKEGADEDFIAGLKKEAIIRPMLSAIGTGFSKIGPAISSGLSKVGPALVRGFEHGLTGATVGGVPFGLPGALAGAAFGGLGGSLGYGKASLLGAAALGGTALAGRNIFGDSGNDVTGNPANRNRAIPIASNKTTGTLGGAMMGGLLANEMGMSGPAAWMMPVLGGLAGYHHLPNLMDKWKDPYGFGANAISGGAASLNRSMPLVD